MKKIWIALLLMCASLPMARAQSQVVIVANPGFKSGEITKNELRDVFTGVTKNLRDGERAIPVLLKKGAANDAFLAAYLDMKGNDLIVAWRALLFSGKASMPRTFDTDAEVVDYVAHTDGAIGYIASGSPHVGVKVLGVK